MAGSAMSFYHLDGSPFQIFFCNADFCLYVLATINVRSLMACILPFSVGTWPVERPHTEKVIIHGDNFAVKLLKTVQRDTNLFQRPSSFVHLIGAARQLNRSEATLARFMRRHEIQPGVRSAKKPAARQRTASPCASRTGGQIPPESCHELHISRKAPGAWDGRTCRCHCSSAWHKWQAIALRSNQSRRTPMLRRENWLSAWRSAWRSTSATTTSR